MNKITMRDAFFERLYELARKDRNILIVSADMGAPSLDPFRSHLGDQFINVGIAEHNMVTLAAGLALSGKKVFTYAIMPFATARCYEMIRVNFSMMNLPVSIVGVGAGFSYDDSGPTHHSPEDLAFMRTLPHMTILNASDSTMAAQFASLAVGLRGPSYLRLDRGLLPILYAEGQDLTQGLHIHRRGKDLWILATGNMVHRALEVADELAGHSLEAGVVDVFRLKPLNGEALLEAVRGGRGVVTLEEHMLIGGLGSAVAELLADEGKALPLKRIGLADQFYYVYGGRDHIQRTCGLDADSVTASILKWFRKNDPPPARVGQRTHRSMEATHG